MSPVLRSNDQRHGLRSPKAQISLGFVPLISQILSGVQRGYLQSTIGVEFLLALPKALRNWLQSLFPPLVFVLAGHWQPPERSHGYIDASMVQGTEFQLYRHRSASLNH